MGWAFFHVWSAALVAVVAALRGRSVTGWAVRALLLTSPVALVLLLLKPSLRTEPARRPAPIGKAAPAATPKPKRWPCVVEFADCFGKPDRWTVDPATDWAALLTELPKDAVAVMPSTAELRANPFLNEVVGEMLQRGVRFVERERV